MLPFSLRRRIKRWRLTYRETRMFVLALRSSHHPVLAHIVPVRRCNLACTYCNEFDNFSKPVALAAMLQRIDRLAELGATIVAISGGEPLLHPELDEIVRRIRHHGMIAQLLTNAYLLTAERIERLNRAGLDHMQISIDNLLPDAVSKKSLKVLDKKLSLLAHHAEFQVNVNSVVGSSIERSEDALAIARRAIELGLTSTTGIIHDRSGQVQALKPDQRGVIERIEALSRPVFSFARHNPWQENLSAGLPNDWHCRAGGRYLYICEDGLVHYCSQQRGHPAIPLLQYTHEDLDRESSREKSCAPFCTISCVHRVALLDSFRENPKRALDRLFPVREGIPPEHRFPFPVRVLQSVFLSPNDPARASFFRKAALRVFGIE